jgi:hypothetical protein
MIWLRTHRPVLTHFYSTGRARTTEKGNGECFGEGYPIGTPAAVPEISATGGLCGHLFGY